MTQHNTTFGFEIEFLRSACVDTVLSNVRAAGQDKGKPALANVSDQRNRYNTEFFSDRWVQAYDCSCGWEMKSQPLRDTSEVELVMKAIREAGGTVDRRCGLHVHVDVTSLSFDQRKRLARIYLQNESAMEQLLPRSRRGRTQYASSNRFSAYSYEAADWDAIQDDMSLRHAVARNGKYSKLNLIPFESKGTWEFRGHQGTLNFKKIDAWASLIAAMINLAQSDTELPSNPLRAMNSFSEMLDQLIPFTPAAQEVRTYPRPRSGSKTGRVWDQADWLRASAESERYFRGIPGGRTVIANAAAMAARISVDTGVALGTCKTQLSRWAATNWVGRRVSSNESILRSYLERRQATLAR